MIAGIILSALALLANIGSGISSFISQKKQIDANREQYEDWKSYNTPENQMNRLSAAGLNPYMVNGVSNTLSQPFQVGQNSGIAELFQGLSQSSSNAANMFTNSAIKQESNAIRKDQVEINRDKLELEKGFTELKKELFKTAKKKGDAQAALFWSSVTQKDLVSNFLRRSEPFRVGKSFYDYLMAQQSYTFNESINPFKLEFYAPYQRAMINSLNSRSHYLNFLEDFNRDKLLQDFIIHRENLGLKSYWNRMNYDKDVLQFDKRLNLSDRYFNLAKNKWYSGMIFDWLGYRQKNRQQLLNLVPYLIK